MHFQNMTANSMGLGHFSKEAQTLLNHFHQLLLEPPGCSQASQGMLSLWHVFSLPCSLIPPGHAPNTSPGWHHGQTHLKWLLSTHLFNYYPKFLTIAESWVVNTKPCLSCVHGTAGAAPISLSTYPTKHLSPHSTA